MGERKIGPKGPGRPPDVVPENWDRAIMDMFRDGKTTDEIREVLKEAGHNVSKKAIASVAEKLDPSLLSAPNGGYAALGIRRDLESVAFDEYRDVVDDFIIEGRTHFKIRCFLIMQGFEIEPKDMEEYCEARVAELSKLAADPKEASASRHKSHLNWLRRRIAEVWHNMPHDKRYTERVLGLLVQEFGAATRWEIEKLAKSLEGNKDASAANEEIERKLGIVEEEQPEPESAPEQEPSGAEAPMGATV